MTFRVGDEVKYTVTTLAYDGIVIDYDYRNFPRSYRCRWSKGAGSYHTWEPEENLELIFKELPYDPEQQGDREDDI